MSRTRENAADTVGCCCAPWIEGLLRIGSFVALGFSLILVGWIYSRFLPDAHLTGTLDAAENFDDHTRG